VIIGASVVFLFASLLIMAVGRAAQRVVLEVRNQFRTHPGIMDYTEKPDYSRVVDIVTADSLRELVTPGLLAVLAPIAVGFTFGYAPLGAYLVGAIATGVLMAIFLANSGGAWDNAKKLVEDGHHGGKGSDAHAATVIGDTVGDPFKDTAGPAINPLIKVMNLVSLLIATSVVKYSSNVGLRAGVAIVAVGVIIAAIVVSKRRAASMGEEAPASVETGGATAPAAVAGTAGTADATVGAVPPARPGAETAANGNGHVGTGSSKPADSAPNQPKE
jgi:K(+)-stimulated pyrophosphate-energized sodium pump